MGTAKGEAVNTAKLTAKDVVEIRRLARSGVPIARIRDLFPKVKHDTISLAACGRTWASLPGAVPKSEIKKAKIPGALPGSGATLLTAEKVRQIKARPNDKGVDLAIEFGVRPVTISAIRHKRIWAHVG